MIIVRTQGAVSERVRQIRADSDRGSLPMLMLVILVSVTLGATLMSMMLTASHTSQYSQSRVLALAAAQSGVDAVVGELRSATSSTSAKIGDSGRLPCGPFTSGAGTAGANRGVLPASNDGGTTSYSVTIAYYDVDPSTLGTSDLTTKTSAGGQQMACTNNGTYNSTTAIRTPRFALITSTGASPQGPFPETRTVQTTYNFQVLNQNIAGGVIRLTPSSTTQWCLDAGSSPAVGSAVSIQVCSTSNPPAAQQTWAYRADLSIELVSSVSNPSSAGLCLDTGANPTQHNVNDGVVLERCGVSDAQVCPAGYTPAAYHTAYPNATCSVSPWNQQWSVDDSSRLRGALPPSQVAPGGTDLDNVCITGNQPSAASTPGPTVNLQICNASGTTQVWIPSPRVGPGAAGAASQQLVNFEYFSKCLDDTLTDPNYPYMILYTCKQDPDQSKVTFNQRFIASPGLATGPTTVLITVNDYGTIYCLRSPQIAGGYPTLVVQGAASGQCPTSVTVAASNSPFLWTVSQRYANAAGTVSLSYANRYTIEDASATPLCLAPGPSTDQYYDGNGDGYLKGIVASCDGSDAQKWNATAISSTASFTNTTEMNTTGG